MLGWVSISAVFWIAGALAQHETRALLWLIAILCEYASPMFGFALPGMGRSRAQEWTIEGGHLAERCQLFVIVAQGETVLASGATLADAGSWDASVVMALLATFVGGGCILARRARMRRRPSRARTTRAASVRISTTSMPS